MSTPTVSERAAIWPFRIHRQPEEPCPFCTGKVTLGHCCGIPLAWHTDPHCRRYQLLPDTEDGVLELVRCCKGRRP